MSGAHLKKGTRLGQGKTDPEIDIKGVENAIKNPKRRLIQQKTPGTVTASQIVCIHITDNEKLLLYNQNALAELLYLLPKIIRIAPERLMAKETVGQWYDRI